MNAGCEDRGDFTFGDTQGEADVQASGPCPKCNDTGQVSGGGQAYEIIPPRRPDPTLAELQADIKRWTIEKGWADDRSVGDLLMLMVSEVAEAYEEWRNHHEPNEVYVHAGKPEGIPIELADVVIRILSFCSTYDVDLQDAVLRKMAYNETRPHRHGGKRA